MSTKYIITAETILKLAIAMDEEFPNLGVGDAILNIVELVEPEVSQLNPRFLPKGERIWTFEKVQPMYEMYVTTGCTYKDVAQKFGLKTSSEVSGLIKRHTREMEERGIPQYNTPKYYLQKAIDYAGSQAKLSKALGLTQQGVSFLINQAQQISPETAIAIEEFTNGEVLRENLRPDLYKGMERESLKQKEPRNG